MNYKVFFGLFFVLSMALCACGDGCVECSGPTAPREICKDDYQETSDYQNEISAYEALDNAICEEK